MCSNVTIMDFKKIDMNYFGSIYVFHRNIFINTGTTCKWENTWIDHIFFIILIITFICIYIYWHFLRCGCDTYHIYTNINSNIPSPSHLADILLFPPWFPRHSYRFSFNKQASKYKIYCAVTFKENGNSFVTLTSQVWIGEKKSCTAKRGYYF